MKRPTSSRWLVGAFALCFAIVAADLWRGSYQEYLERGFSWRTLPLLAGIALLLPWAAGTGGFTSAVVVGCVFPAVVFSQVLLDCMDGPARHNLWPFEIAVAVVVGMLVAFPSAAIGRILRHVTHGEETPADHPSTPPSA